VTRIRAERDVQAFLATIVQRSDDALLSYSPAGTILTWNRGAEKVFGYRADEAFGQPVAMLLPSDALASSVAHARAGESISRNRSKLAPGRAENSALGERFPGQEPGR
jgi:PAS domain S-box-containing protein